MYKYLITKLKEYIFVFLTATIILILSSSKSFSGENVFIVENIEVKGNIGINFSRGKYINEAFFDSFEILMSKILVSSDLNKISNIKLEKIKNLISNFQIFDESFLNNKYQATFKVFYNGNRVKKLLVQKNISFSQPKNISAVFFPVLFINDEFQELNENFFYKQWENINIKNELISFILPLEDIDDFSEIKKIKNNIEGFNIDKLITKYNTTNFVFTLLHYENKNLNVYVKTNFNNNKISKNISYDLDNIKDEKKLNIILKKLKTEITDIWKSENVINLSIPLSLRIQFKHRNIQNLEKIKKTFYKINIIENSFLEETNINFSHFNIYYFGNPKKLKSELLKFGYLLKNEQSHWEIYLNE